jgi:hypothetical protein
MKLLHKPKPRNESVTRTRPLAKLLGSAVLIGTLLLPGLRDSNASELRKSDLDPKYNFPAKCSLLYITQYREGIWSVIKSQCVSTDPIGPSQIGDTLSISPSYVPKIVVRNGNAVWIQ